MRHFLIQRPIEKIIFILALGHRNPPTHPVVYLAVPPPAFLTIVRLLARLRASPEKAA